jgi:predicted nucleotidyltransferase
MAVTVEDAAATLRRRDEARRAAAARRAADLLGRLSEAKRLLVDVHRSRRVVLFGSLARGDSGERSDVDLAVEGLAPDAYFPALADVTVALGCLVDLVRVEIAPPSLLARIAEEGREL